MAWIYESVRKDQPVVKLNGQCCKKSQHKFCPYWYAKHDTDNPRRVVGFRCALFNEDKSGYASLPACNEKYGLTYDGRA